MGKKEFIFVIIILVIVVVFAVLGNAQLFGWSPVGIFPAGSENNTIGIACTQEAKLCPDGSYVGRTGPNCEFAACPGISSSTTVNTSNWKTYSSANFGFTFKYPPTWQSSGDVLSIANPQISFWPPYATTTYNFSVFVLNNPQNLAPAAFVAQMIAEDRAQDASNSAQGPAPQMTPQFAKEYSLTVNGNPAYELYGVFAFDENREQIYIQQNKQMLEFMFPVADANPNLANPAANNAIAHQIIDTLQLNSSH